MPCARIVSILLDVHSDGAVTHEVGGMLMLRCSLVFHVCLALFLCAGTVLSTNAVAADYHQYAFDNVKVTAINDRTNAFAAELFPTLSHYPDSKKLLHNGAFAGVVRTFLLQMGKKLILVDGGWGAGPHKGRTVEILRSLGYAPEQITDILVTHLDIDHVSGLINNGKCAYPKATLWITHSQYNAWTQGEPRNKASVAMARNVMSLYKDAGKMCLYHWGDAVLPKISAMQADGHTPGHTVFCVQAGQKKFYLLGDLLHAGDLQLAHPECSSQYDAQPARAAAIRREILQRCAQEGSIVAGAHFLPIGVVRTAGTGFAIDVKAVPAVR